MQHIVANVFQLTEADEVMVERDYDRYLQFTPALCEWFLAHDIGPERYSTWTTATRYLISFYDDRDAVFFRIAWS